MIQTQGLFTKTVAGKVVLKVVAGCDGHNINKLAVRIQQDDRLIDPKALFQAALEAGVGCKDCLVVQTLEGDYYDGDKVLNPLYREKFDEPQFNPRLKSGMVARFVAIDLPD